MHSQVALPCIIEPSIIYGIDSTTTSFPNVAPTVTHAHLSPFASCLPPVNCPTPFRILQLDLSLKKHLAFLTAAQALHLVFLKEYGSSLVLLLLLRCFEQITVFAMHSEITLPDINIFNLSNS